MTVQQKVWLELHPEYEQVLGCPPLFTSIAVDSDGVFRSDKLADERSMWVKLRYLR